MTVFLEYLELVIFNISESKRKRFNFFEVLLFNTWTSGEIFSYFKRYYKVGKNLILNLYINTIKSYCSSVRSFCEHASILRSCWTIRRRILPFFNLLIYNLGLVDRETGCDFIKDLIGLDTYPHKWKNYRKRGVFK